ncbi:TPA: ABC transporter ATP-binding protein [Candidatus Gracilibacteria bacterium]|nr:ABC transporter ATP-binding protein [Candidatus Gracilibacteria bacterium]
MNKPTTLFQEYIKIVKSQKLTFTILVLTMVISVGIEIITPLYYKDLANIFAQNFTLDLYTLGWSAIISLLIAYSIQILVWRIFEWFIIPFEVGGKNTLSLYAFDVLTRQKFLFFQNEFAGSLIKKHSRFVAEFEQIADWFFFKALINTVVIIGGFIIFAQEDLYFAFIFFAWCIFFLVVSGLGFYFKFRFDKKRAQLESRVGSLFSDTFSNIFTVKTAQIEPTEKLTIQNKLSDLYAVTKISWILTGVIFGIQAVLMVGMELYMVSGMLEKWKIGNFYIGEFVLFQTILFLIFNKVWDFGISLRSLFTSVANASEMLEIINNADIEKDESFSKDLQINAGKIEMKNMTFAHDSSKNLFENFNLTITAGEHIALVGESGSGKTTITNLLFRFFIPQKGEILFDDISANKYTLKSLRNQISIVPQHPEMFHRTLRENITLGKNISDKKIFEVLEKSQSLQFVNNLEKGLDTVIGERGVKLSGGEKQRIAIARAFLDNAPIVILDEATSALDSITEKEIQKGIFELIKNKTAIIIAHRLSTVQKMDRIMVMKTGKIVEEGVHKDLILQNDMYAHMWKKQIS